MTGALTGLMIVLFASKAAHWECGLAPPEPDERLQCEAQPSFETIEVDIRIRVGKRLTSFKGTTSARERIPVDTVDKLLLALLNRRTDVDLRELDRILIYMAARVHRWAPDDRRIIRQLLERHTVCEVHKAIQKKQKHRLDSQRLKAFLI